MRFDVVADIVTGLCVLALFIAVLVNFASAQPRAFRERRSPVATASMTAFGLLVYATIRLRWGALQVAPTWPVLVLRGAGLALLGLGTAYNVWGRRWLKGNWADHVRIYADQTLVTQGPYRFTRHPLYASLIWMVYGASLAYLNPLAALENTAIFLPAMIYRACLEDAELAGRFGEAHANYCGRVGLFFPRWPSRRGGGHA